MLQTIHGHPVLAWCQTEVQGDGIPRGIVLVQVRPPGPHYPKGEYCTAWYRQGDSEWSSGHYISDRQEAWQDFCERVELNTNWGRTANPRVVGIRMV